ncbi:MAG: translation initiation factor IF-2 [Bacteroidales bacterium]|nr:translation initiation factor IF-2 [Bacteroidales bacterium]
MAGQESIRINKVLKEFNIGLNSLVEFLNKKGFEIENSPVAKITPEAYELVQKEFGKDQRLKDQSRNITRSMKEVAEHVKRKKAEEEQDKQDEEVRVKTTMVDNHQRIGIKVLGTIDLDKKPAAADAKVEPKVESQPAPQPEPVVVAEPARPVQEPVEVKPVEVKAEVKEQAPKVVDQPESKPIQEPKVQPKVESKPEVKVAPKAAQEPKVENKPAAQNKEQTTLKDLIKLDEHEWNRSNAEHMETKKVVLSAPVILDKIELPTTAKKTSDPKNKGKRERIKGHREKVDVTREGNNNASNNAQKNNNKGNNNAPSRPNAPKNDNTGNNKKKKNREVFKPIKTEIDEDQIQKQIKETYARMTEGRGKTKGSKHRREKRELASMKMHEEMELQELSNNILKVTEFVTVNELAIMMGNTPVTKVIEACMNLGLMVSINQRLDAEALVLVAEEFGYEIEFVTAEIKEAIQEEEDQEADLVERPPIVTVMGHVDHGKTSLLDNIRQTNVIAGEAGGITQHIGAYNVKLPNGRRITFLDTPGHEAFTAMRARGAKITDLVIIIVAADDAIMPQTVEAINHAQAAGVPMIFAINKIDKAGANPERIREQLANMNILVEDWGGKYQCQEISAKNGINVDLLLEKVLLEADLLELKANPNKRAKGSIIESSLDKGRGYLATIMVQAGTLHVGDVMLCGSYTGKVKAMFNERGQKITEAGPSTPVSVLGLNGAPTAGETFNVMDDEKEAKDLANKREQLLRIQGLRTQKHITLEEIGRRIAIGNFQELNIIVKGDVDGSIEALSDSLIKLSTEEIHVNVIHKAVGAISESDVLLAVASNAIIIGFQVRPSANARKLADKEEIEIRMYSVIYDAINEVKSGIEGMLAPEEKEEVTATAEVRETFKISKVGTIAGCMVKEGKLIRAAKVRVIRDGIVIYTGELGSLKRFKDDVKEVQSGYDCGLNVAGYNDIKVGDVIEAFQIVQIKRTL